MVKNKNSSVKWIFLNSLKVLPSVAILTLIGVLVSYISVKFAVASMQLLDSATGKNNLSFSSCILNICLLLAIDLLGQVAYTLLDIRVRTKYNHHLQRRLFKTIITRSCPDIGKYHSGELINRLTNDINMINTNIVDVIPGTFTLVSGIAFSFIEMFKLDMTLSIICLALGPAVLFSATIYGRKMKGLYKDCRQSDGKIRSFMQECIQNIIVVKAFRREKHFSSHADVLRKENFKLNMKRGYISIGVNILYYVALTAAYYLAVAWCAYKISLGIMTVGAFTAIIQLVGSIQSPFRDVAGIIPKFYAACASAERIMEIEEAEAEVTDCKMDFNKFSLLKVKNLSFSYDDEHILKNASFDLKRGEIAVIHGQSGIGKSTFFKILLGVLKPTDGMAVLELENNTQNAGASTRAAFSYVPQGNMLISGTVKENIAFFDEIDEDRIERASVLACVKEFVDTLPDGFNTVIGEKGTGLSEGQIQRIAIARAFYSDAPIILLDEATSALDEATELKILENIKQLTDKTCIIITHRPQAFEICDKRILLENSEFIVE